MPTTIGRLAVAFAAGVSLLTACGTTVPPAAQVAAGTATDGLSAGAGPTTAAGSDALVSTPGSVATDNAGSGSDGALAAAPSSGVTPTQGAPLVPGGARVGPAGTAPGVTATTIKIGIYTVQGFSSFGKSVGVNVDVGDQAAQARAVIKYLNAHGGLAGRKIVPVFHDMNVGLVAQNPSSEYQAACSAWTEDDRVYAVASPVGTVNDTLYACLSKAGVATVSAGDSQDASFFEKYGNWYYQPTDMNLRRILSNNVDALSSVGFFGKSPKIGVLHLDTANETAAVDKGLKPALARHGLTLAETFALPTDSSASSAYSSAVLRFKTLGITHVLFTFASPLLFMSNADSQKYYPRYGMHSRNSPAALLEGNASADQQHGAMGIGWQPMNDVNSSHDPGLISARQGLCLKLLKEAGQDTSVRATALVGLWICDNLFFLQDALLRAPAFSIAGFRAGAESVSRFEAASTFRSTFQPGRLHDGASAYRVFAFKDNCKCYQYVSPLRTAS